MAQNKTISFYGTATARSIVTLCTPRISTPFKVKDITATFPLGCGNEMLLRFFISLDNHAPTTGLPSGISILRDYGQVDYLVGDDVIKTIRHDLENPEGGAYLKVHATNNDYYDHAIDVQMTIEIQ